MHTIRTSRIVLATAAATLLIAAVAPAAATGPQPVVKLTAKISPSRISKPKGSVGTPLALTVDTAFSTNPPGGTPPTITKAVVSFPVGAVTNGRLFPSCSARQLTRAHNVLRRCPKGSQIGTGIVHAEAVQIGVFSIAKATLFNGPGGRSVTFNFHATIPADINESFDAPLRRAHGKYSYTLTLVIPHSLQEILPGVFVAVHTFHVVTKGTVIQKIHGRKVKRGYIEANKCPKSGKAPLHGDFFFLDGSTTTSDSNIAFKCLK
jgi:hypothetical protein